MKKILVVDNDRIMLRLMSRLLEEKGYQVVTVENGINALDVLKTYTPDAIFIDLVMPNIDGKLLCRIIRGMEKFNDVYLIILSAISAEEWVDIAKLGANVCIAKGPFDEMSRHIAVALDQPETTSERCLSGEILGVNSVYPRGITQELLSVKRHFEVILDKMSEGIIEINSEGRIVFANSVILSMIDIPEENLLGSYFVDLFSGDEHLRVSDLMEKMDKRTKRITQDSPLRLNKNHITLDILSLDEDEPKSLIILRDVSEHMQAEKALQESEEKYRLLAENASDVIWTMDMDLNYTYISPAIEKIQGWSVEEAASLTINDVLTSQSLEIAFKRIEAHMAHGAKTGNYNITDMFELELYCKDGTTIWTEISASFILGEDGKPVGILGVTRDITERNKLEDQLLQAQKMEAIGTLAGGIAHEFNNVLAIILGNAELAMFDITNSNPAKEYFGEIQSAALRGKDVVSQILSFARKSISKRKPVQIGPAIRGTLKLIRASIPTTIAIRPNISCESETVMADSTQINQILMNLCANARDAMKEEGGVLEVKLKNTILDERSATRYEGLMPGNYVKLIVTDNGTGIDSSIIARIFEPYFTTKSLAEGTGMGLAVAHGIVKSHDGAIRVQSELGRGTTVEVLFPCVEMDAVGPDSKDPKELPSGNERILLVDDEKNLVRAYTNIMKRLGYDVVSFTSPTEALELFKSQLDRFDLVMTDMTMPDMTGEELSQEMIKIRSDIPVILCTGYSDLIDEEKAKEIGIKGFIMKPVTVEALAVEVRKVLDGERS
ncbi:response regulator [Thermodesulfobacteriota bacterium]